MRGSVQEQQQRYRLAIVKPTGSPYLSFVIATSNTIGYEVEQAPNYILCSTLLNFNPPKETYRPDS